MSVGLAMGIGRSLIGSLLTLGGLLSFSAAAQMPVPTLRPTFAAPERVVPSGEGQILLSFAPVVHATAPAVVNITAERMGQGGPTSPLMADPFFRRFMELPRQPRTQTSLGSGVIIDPGGHVVTNTHVIEGATAITVILADRREFPATVVRLDASADVALLQLDTEGAALPALSFGDSDRLEVGDLVLAIGNPFGIGQSVSSGIVSATARSTGGLDVNIPLIQTDAAINPGNSGGALVDLTGRLVGLNTAILTRGGGSIGVGFAVPASYVRAFVEQSLGAAERPWLGARLQPVDGGLAEALGLAPPQGVLLQELFPGASADAGGLHQGDVVLAIDGIAVDDPGAITLRLAVAAGQGRAALDVWRDGAAESLDLALSGPPRLPLPEPRELRGDHPLAGLTVVNISPAYALEHDLDPFQVGVVVDAVAARSPANRLRIRPGDRFVDVGGVTIRRTDDLERALQDALPPLRVVLERGGQRLQLVLS